MSHDEDRTFYITPSRFQWTKFKDDLHFYVSLGIIPITLVILYTNIFIGRATLTEIPEGYEPKHWEYFDVSSLVFIYLLIYHLGKTAFAKIIHFQLKCVTSKK